MRKALWLCCAIGVAVLAVSGCGSKGITPKANTIFLDPDYATMSIASVGILTMANLVGEVDAEKILGVALEAQIVNRKDYEFLTVQRVMRKAQAGGMSADLESLRRQWVHQHTFNAELARKLANEIKVDAFLVGEITKWKTMDLRAEESGYPMSSVGCTVYLMDARTGKKLWEGRADREVKGPYWNPEEQGGTGYVDEAGIARGSGGTPVQIVKAPSIREVADEVAADIVTAIPPRPGFVAPPADQGDSEDE